jgi:hypothetical protein
VHGSGRTRAAAGHRRALVLGAAALVVPSLAGCSLIGTAGGGEAPPPTPAPSASTPDSADAPATLVPGGTAEENRPLFDAVSSSVIAADPDADGRAIVDALIAAGFDRAAIEVTDDTTAIGRAADAIQFSVLASDGCIIGERSGSGYAGLVAPVLGTGRCLVGETRVIDW